MKMLHEEAGTKDEMKHNFYDLLELTCKEYELAQTLTERQLFFCH